MPERVRISGLAWERGMGKEIVAAREGLVVGFWAGKREKESDFFFNEKAEIQSIPS